jgi:hypothetical protein
VSEILYTGPWRSLNQIKLANASNGGHWFSDGAMRFFNSRFDAPRTVYGGRLFISSEVYDPHAFDAERRYSIRVADNEASIRTLGDFRQYETLDEARKAARQHVQDMEPWFMGDPRLPDEEVSE